MKRIIKKIINRIFYNQRIRVHGKNNSFEYPSSAKVKKVKIDVWGNNNKIILDENVYLNNAKIIIGFKKETVDNAIIKIGKNSKFNSIFLQIGEDGSEVIIGENCMCSYNVDLNCTDTHSIFDENGNLINVGQSIIIGNHVWLCKDVKIMKNTNIPDGCIVAQGSIVTKKFDKENCILAGNPARIVKENIHWDSIRPNDYLKTCCKQ